METFEIGVIEGMEKTALSPETKGRAWAERQSRHGGALNVPFKKAKMYDDHVLGLLKKNRRLEAKRMSMTMIRALKKAK